MATLQIDAIGDWDLTSKRLQIVRDPALELAIKLRNRFLFFRGEWFLDKREGVPYFELILIKNPNVSVIKRVFQEVIFSAGPGLVDTADVDVIYDSGARTAAVNFSCRLVDGRILSGGLGRPFLINGEPLTDFSL